MMAAASDGDNDDMLLLQVVAGLMTDESNPAPYQSMKVLGGSQGEDLLL